MNKWDPHWDTTSWVIYDNYWAGAKKACDDIGMSLPDKLRLLSIYQAGKKDPSLGLPTSGCFWSSSASSPNYAYYMNFGDGYPYTYFKYDSFIEVLCVGD